MLTHSVLFFPALGISPRPVSGSVSSKLVGSVCSKLGVVLLQLCTFRKRCGGCSHVADVRVESTEHMMRVHATQSAVPLWLGFRSGAAASPILCIMFCVWISNCFA